jgi:hypothetical protein
MYLEGKIDIKFSKTQEISFTLRKQHTHTHLHTHTQTHTHTHTHTHTYDVCINCTNNNINNLV